MSKLNIKTKLKTKENNLKYNLKGIKNNNKISFVENNIKVNMYIEKDSIKIIRKTEEYEMELCFKQSLTITGKYDIKNIGILEIKTDTKKLIIEEGKIYIEYILYVNKENLGLNTYEIEYEAI